MWARLSKLKKGTLKLSCCKMSKRIKVDQNAVNSNTHMIHNVSNTGLTSFKNIVKSNKVTYLKSPAKSQSDVKEYSVIKLHNGLIALLVSDKSQILNPNDLSASEDSDCESVGVSESSSEEEEVNEKDVNNDTNRGDNEEKLAACSLCIGVGSFSDPENIPGLAHFLEHMIFMGSEKYPKENEYDVYIKKKGGSDNASTECEYTTFYFDCHEAYLLGAMEIFSQLFISPLMKRESMTKEREAIESEFQMNLPSDESRRSQLLCSLADSSNPAHKFMWGNLVTLRDKIKDDELYEAVHEFRKRHYSAHRMTLAVQARLPLETLENWVVDCFQNVPNNELTPNEYFLSVPPFRQKDFLKLYIVEPVKDINQIDITWVVPPTLQLYKSKPLNYLSWIIGHEGKGSLISYLRKKLWCFGITVSAGGDGTEENSIYSLFSISLTLTQEGTQHVEEILNLVFQYIKMFQSKGPQEKLFREIQMTADTRFRFNEEVSSSENVEQLSENMHFYSSEDYITGMELFFDYEPELIKSFLNYLMPNKVNIMISSKILASLEKLDKNEIWFGTKYMCKEISSEWIKNWQSVDLNHCFHLPEENQFLPTNFTILPPPSTPENFPTKIFEDTIMELWHKQDVLFKLPNAFCCLHLVSPLSHKSPQNAAMIDLFILILKQSLSEELYPAIVAQLDYDFFSGDKGIVITVNGYNEKLKLLLKAVVDGMMTLKNNIKQDLFLVMKDDLIRHYSNENLKTGFLARDLRMFILLESHWTALDKIKALTNITCEELVNFISQYFEHLFIQCLIQGNISKNEAIEFGLLVKNSLLCKPLSSDSIPEIKVHQLPSGEHFCVVHSYNDEDANSTVTNYYQSGPGTIQESCVIEMLLMIMEEPLFDSLRTKHQLGYDVSCSLKETFGILGFSVSVHCQSDRNSVESVEARITEFLNDFLQILKKTPIEDYEEVQESLIKLKNCADIHLKQEVKRNWDEIKMREYVFDRHVREREYIQKLPLAEVINWFESTAGLLNPSKIKKLSTQVVGKVESGDKSFKSNCEQKRLDFGCLKNELRFVKKQETSEKFIFNLKEFKETLALYPVHKISS